MQFPYPPLVGYLPHPYLATFLTLYYHLVASTVSPPPAPHTIATYEVLIPGCRLVMVDPPPLAVTRSIAVLQATDV